MLLVAASCGDRQKPEASTDASEITLTYWPAPNPEEVKLADSLVRMWNRIHPDVQVRMQPIPVSQSTEEVLLAAIAGRTTPDICSNIWPGALHEYTRAGGLLPLDEFRDFDSVFASRVPKELQETFKSERGQFFQMPWKTNPLMMFYNVRLFREAGVVDVPDTYSGYLRAAAKVTRDHDGDGQTDVWMGERDIRPIWWQRLFDFYPFYIGASGGQTLFEAGSVAFENKHAEQVIGFFQECYRQGYYPRTWFQGGDPFLLEKKATHFAGPWQVATLRKLAPHIQYGIVPLPVPDDHEGPVYTSGDFKNIAIFSTCKYPEAAWEFLKFLIKPEHDLLLLQIANQIPIRGGLLTDSLYARYFADNPEMVLFAVQARHTRGVDKAPDLKEIFDAISQEFEACAVYGRRSAQQAVQNAANRVRLLLEWNQ
jgi:multiple sugar transport system substrate-binding protein